MTGVNQRIVEIVGEFLSKNGFVKKDEFFLSGKCSIQVCNEYYAVKYKEGEEHFEWFSNDLLMYTLIGFLTYNGLMDKNYVSN
jgi:hypothetical protein